MRRAARPEAQERDNRGSRSQKSSLPERCPAAEKRCASSRCILTSRMRRSRVLYMYDSDNNTLCAFQYTCPLPRTVRPSRA